LVVGDSAPFLDLLVSLLKNGSQGAQTAGGELLGFRLVSDGQQHGDRLAVARDEHRLLAASLQVLVELSRDLRG